MSSRAPKVAFEQRVQPVQQRQAPAGPTEVVGGIGGAPVGGAGDPAASEGHQVLQSTEEGAGEGLEGRRALWG
jgi:hypothetical protein